MSVCDDIAIVTHYSDGVIASEIGREKMESLYMKFTYTIRAYHYLAYDDEEGAFNYHIGDKREYYAIFITMKRKYSLSDQAITVIHANLSDVMITCDSTIIAIFPSQPSYLIPRHYVADHYTVSQWMVMTTDKDQQ